jgi:hypothetical protein
MAKKKKKKRWKQKKKEKRTMAWKHKFEVSSLIVTLKMSMMLSERGLDLVAT